MKQSRNNKLFLFIIILLIIICIYYYFNNNEHYTLSPETILNIPKPINIGQSMNEYTLKRTLNDNRSTNADMISVIRAIQNDNNDNNNKILWDIKKDRNMFQIYINNKLIQIINSTGTDSIIIGYQKLTVNTFNLYYSINGDEQTKKSDIDNTLDLTHKHTIKFFADSTTTPTTREPTTTTTTISPTTTTTTTIPPTTTTTTTLPPTTTTTTTLPPTTTIPPTTTSTPTTTTSTPTTTTRTPTTSPQDWQKYWFTDEWWSWNKQKAEVVAGQQFICTTHPGNNIYTWGFGRHIAKAVIGGGKGESKRTWKLEVTAGSRSMTQSPGPHTQPLDGIYVGVAASGWKTPRLPEFAGNPKDLPGGRLLSLGSGGLYGAGKIVADPQGINVVKVGDVIGLHLDAKRESLTFYRNGTVFGPGFGDGSLWGPNGTSVVLVVGLGREGQAVTLLEDGNS